MGAGCTVGQYKIVRVSASGLQLDNTGFNTSSATCEVSGDAISAEFTRSIANGAYSISMNGSTPLAWAIGYDLATFSAGHEVQGVTAVDMKTGATSSLGRKPLHLAHGSLNFIAWGILLPVGVLLARFTKSVPVKSGPPLWFNLHRWVQSTGLLFTVVALVLALVMVKDEGKAHFANAHGKLGLVVTLAGVAQPLNALIRPHPKPRTKKRVVWELFHKSMGYGSVVVAVAAVFTGLQAIQPKAAQATNILYAVYVAVLGTSFLALELRLRLTSSPPQQLPSHKGPASPGAAELAVSVSGQGATAPDQVVQYSLPAGFASKASSGRAQATPGHSTVLAPPLAVWGSGNNVRQPVAVELPSLIRRG